MKSRTLFGIGFFFLTISGYSQEYAFKVLANKGANEYKSGDSWQALKTGASLKAGDELKVTEMRTSGSSTQVESLWSLSRLAITRLQTWLRK